MSKQTPGTKPLPSSYREFLGEERPSIKSLQRYLSRMKEWNRTEFKEYADTLGSKFQQTVASFANGSGGEVFVGVNDQGKAIGTKLTPQAIQQALARPPGATEQWYSMDGSRCVAAITEVPGSSLTKGRPILVVEVGVPGMPLFVDVKGKGELIIRRGESSMQASGSEAIDWYRARSREKLLREIYLEIRTTWDRLSGDYPRYILGDMDLYPYLRARMQDGSFYTFLTKEDIAQVLGRGLSSGYQPGLIADLLELRYVVELDRVEELQGVVHYGRWADSHETKRLFASTKESLGSRLESFANYLERQGIRISKD